MNNLKVKIILIDSNQAKDCTGLIKCIKEYPKSDIDDFFYKRDKVGNLSCGVNTSSGVFEFWKPQTILFISERQYYINDFVYEKKLNVVGIVETNNTTNSIDIVVDNKTISVRKDDCYKIEASNNVRLTPDRLIDHIFLDHFIEFWNHGEPMKEVDLTMTISTEKLSKVFDRLKDENKPLTRSISELSKTEDINDTMSKHDNHHISIEPYQTFKEKFIDELIEAVNKLWMEGEKDFVSDIPLYKKVQNYLNK